MARRNRQSGVTLPEIAISIAVLIAVFVIFSTRSQAYMKKTKTSGANAQLRMIERTLKQHWIERASFPVGDSGLTPAKPCCEYPNQRCPRSSIGNPIWDELELELMDNKFQFRYVGTMDEVTVTAVGDPDCAGDPVTFTLRGTIVQGDVRFTTTSTGD